MGVSLIYNREVAEEKGVKFVQVWSGNDTDGWEEDGWTVECPDGSKGYSDFYMHFQCKNINLEIRDWFLANVPGSRISD